MDTTTEYCERHNETDLDVLADDRAAVRVLTEAPGEWCSTVHVALAAGFCDDLDDYYPGVLRALRGLRRLQRDGRVEGKVTGTSFERDSLLGTTTYAWRIEESRYAELLEWARGPEVV